VELQLVPLGPVGPGVLELLMNGLPGHLPVQPVVVPIPGRAWGPGLLPSAAAVDALLGVPLPAGAWRLGVTECPMVADDGRRVFGQATLGGPVAVVSLAGLMRPAERLPRRLLISALHELGHLAGVEHCAEPRCVMYPSRSVDHTDRKGPEACAACDARIRAFFAGSA
jgi:archaemetzincin